MNPIAFASAELYDLVSGKWSLTGGMTTVRSTNLVLLHRGEVLAAGGDTNTPNTAELYTLISGTWTAASRLGPGSFGRSTILLQNGLLLALTHTGINPAAEFYDPSTVTWSSTAFPMYPLSLVSLGMLGVQLHRTFQWALLWDEPS